MKTNYWYYELDANIITALQKLILKKISEWLPNADYNVFIISDKRYIEKYIHTLDAIIVINHKPSPDLRSENGKIIVNELDFCYELTIYKDRIEDLPAIIEKFVAQDQLKYDGFTTSDRSNNKKMFNRKELSCALYELYDNFLPQDMGSDPAITLTYFGKMISTFESAWSLTDELSENDREIIGNLNRIIYESIQTHILLNKNMEQIFECGDYLGREAKVIIYEKFQNNITDAINFMEKNFINDHIFKPMRSICDSIITRNNNISLIAGGWNEHMLVFVLDRDMDMGYNVTMINSGAGHSLFRDKNDTSVTVDSGIIVRAKYTVDELRKLLSFIIFYMYCQRGDTKNYFEGIYSIDYLEKICANFNIVHFFKKYENVKPNIGRAQLSGSCTYYSLYYFIKYYVVYLNKNDGLYNKFAKYFNDYAKKIIKNYVDSIKFPYDSVRFAREQYDPNIYSFGIPIYPEELVTQSINTDHKKPVANPNFYIHIMEQVLNRNTYAIGKFLLYDLVLFYFLDLCRNHTQINFNREFIKYMQQMLVHFQGIISETHPTVIGNPSDELYKRIYIYYYETFSLLFVLILLLFDIVKNLGDPDTQISRKINNILKFNKNRNISHNLQLNDQCVEKIASNYNLFYESIKYEQSTESDQNLFDIDSSQLFKIIPIIDNNFVYNVNYIICNSFYKYHAIGYKIYKEEVFMFGSLYKLDIGEDKEQIKLKNIDHKDSNIVDPVDLIDPYWSYSAYKFNYEPITDFGVLNKLIFDLETLAYYMAFDKPLFTIKNKYEYNTTDNLISIYLDNYDLQREKVGMLDTSYLDIYNDYVVIYIVYLLDYFNLITDNIAAILLPRIKNNKIGLVRILESIIDPRNFRVDALNEIVQLVGGFVHSPFLIKINLLLYSAFYQRNQNYANMISEYILGTSEKKQHLDKLVASFNIIGSLDFKDNLIVVGTNRFYNLYEFAYDYINIFFAGNLLIDIGNKIWTKNQYLGEYFGSFSVRNNMLCQMIRNIEYWLVTNYNNLNFMANFYNKLVFITQDRQLIVVDIFNSNNGSCQKIGRIEYFAFRENCYKATNFNNYPIVVPNKMFAFWITSIPYAFMTQENQTNYIHLVNELMCPETNLLEKLSDSIWMDDEILNNFKEELINYKSEPITSIYKIKIGYNGLSLIFPDDIALFVYGIYCIIYQKTDCLDLIFDMLIRKIKKIPESTTNYIEIIIKLLFRHNIFNNKYQHFFAYRANNTDSALNDYRLRAALYPRKYHMNELYKLFPYKIFSSRYIKNISLSDINISPIQNGMPVPNEYNDNTNINEYLRGYRSCTINNKIKTIIPERYYRLRHQILNILYDKFFNTEHSINNFMLNNSRLLYNLLEIKVVNQVINDINAIIIENITCIEYKKIHDIVDQEYILYNNTRTTPEIVLFELNFGNFIRKKQIEKYSAIVAELGLTSQIESIEPKIYNNRYKVHQMLMGSGKTSVIMPLLLYTYICNTNYRYPILLIMPEHLVEDVYNNLTIMHNYGTHNCRLNTLKHSTRDLSTVDTDNFLCVNNDHLYNNTIVIMSGSAIKSVRLNTLENTVIRNSLMIIDEFDSLYDPLRSDLNFPSGDKQLIVDLFGRNNVNKLIEILVDENSINNIMKKLTAEFAGYNYGDKLLSAIRYCLGTEYNYHYGFSLDPIYNMFIAMPYGYVLTPIYGSQFSDVDIALIYTILAYKYSDIRTVDVINFIKKMLFVYSNFKNSLSVEDINKYINNESYNIFRGRLRIELVEEMEINELELYVNKLEIDNERANMFKKMYLEKYIVPELYYYDRMKNCSFIDVISEKFSKLKCGFTGTVNIDLPKFLSDENEFIGIVPSYEDDGAIQVAILNLIAKINFPNTNDIINYVNKDDNNILEKLETIIINSGYNALIDVGAYLKNIPTIDVVAHLLNSPRFRFIFTKIIYIDEDDVQWIAEVGMDIQKYDNIMRKDVFFYCDNKHIIGTDVKNLPYQMRGLVTINQFNRYSDVSQAAFRLRNLNYGHEIFFVLHTGHFGMGRFENRDFFLKYLLDMDHQYKSNAREKLLIQNINCLNRLDGLESSYYLDRYNKYTNIYHDYWEYLTKMIIRPNLMSYDIYKILVSQLYMITKNNSGHDQYVIEPDLHQEIVTEINTTQVMEMELEIQQEISKTLNLSVEKHLFNLLESTKCEHYSNSKGNINHKIIDYVNDKICKKIRRYIYLSNVNIYLSGYIEELFDLKLAYLSNSKGMEKQNYDKIGKNKYVAAKRHYGNNDYTKQYAYLTRYYIKYPSNKFLIITQNEAQLISNIFSATKTISIRTNWDMYKKIQPMLIKNQNGDIIMGQDLQPVTLIEIFLQLMLGKQLNMEDYIGINELYRKDQNAHDIKKAFICFVSAMCYGRDIKFKYPWFSVEIMEDIFYHKFAPEKYINSSQQLTIINAKIKKLDKFIKLCEYYKLTTDQNYLSFDKEKITEFIDIILYFIIENPIINMDISSIINKQLEKLKTSNDYRIISEIIKLINDNTNIMETCKTDYSTKKNFLLQLKQKFQSYRININQIGGTNDYLFWNWDKYISQYHYKYQKYKWKYLALKKIYA